MHVHRAALRAAAVIVTALASAASPAAGPVAADPAAATFTWSGAAEAATGDARTSTAGNWSGGVAPTAGQPVALVFPALKCVSDASCGRVVNDVSGLVAGSVSIVQPGTPYPGPNVALGYYSFEGVELGLAGPLTTSYDLTTGPLSENIVWSLPVDIADTGSSWRLAESVVLRSVIRGGPLAVRTVEAGLSIDRQLEVERFSARSADRTTVSSVWGTLNAHSGGPVRFHDIDVSLGAAELGPLTARDARLSIDDPRPLQHRRLDTVVHGEVSLDHRSELVLAGFRGKHASLVARGTVHLGGARLVTSIDCLGYTPNFVRDATLTYVHGESIWGWLSRSDGSRIRDGELVRPTYQSGCKPGLRIRVDYAPKDVRLTVLRRG